ncbi:MAG TPA: hypothetical protein VEH50_04110 [Methylomirabilota bacterium]|nr:hypothetical protein [Methylomirabilota bacterium]
MVEEVDYEQLLQSLLAERGDLDRMISWVQKRLGRAVEALEPNAPPSGVSAAPIVRFPRTLAPDVFFRMTVPQAIKTYLNIAKRPKSAKDITAALAAGGLTHQAKNLYATVYPTLLRMEGNNEVVRVSKGEWGLTEWYPSGRKASQEQKTESEG